MRLQLKLEEDGRALEKCMERIVVITAKLSAGRAARFSVTMLCICFRVTRVCGSTSVCLSVCMCVCVCVCVSFSGRTAHDITSLRAVPIGVMKMPQLPPGKYLLRVCCSPRGCSRGSHENVQKVFYLAPPPPNSKILSCRSS